MCIRACYDPKVRLEQEKKEEEEKRNSSKSNLRVFGYKHPKVIKFMAYIFKCLKDCLDGKAD